MRSRSLSRYFGGRSNGKASRICCAVHSCSRMSRNVEMHDTSTIMLHNDEDEQHLEQGCRHREKIDRRQLLPSDSSRMSSRSATVASDAGPCIWRRRLPRSGYQAWEVHYGFSALPRLNYSG